MATKFKFKVGDRVRTRSSGIYGEIVSIRQTYLAKDIPCIRTDDGIDLFYTADNLELINRPGVSENSEAVSHPSHYGGDTTYEAIKVIEAWGLGFHLGNVVKYISRAGKKDQTKELEDLEKASWYLQRRIDQLKES